MIIVEGPDGAGKTTLVRQLLDEFPELKVGERGTKNRKELYKVTVPDTYRAVAGAVSGQEGPLIWDRLFYSEFIYAPLGMPPREPMFNPEMRRHLSRIIEALRCPIIVCLPPLETVQKNVLVEDQMDGVTEKIKDIWQSYSRYQFPPHAFFYDYTYDYATGGKTYYEHLLRYVGSYLDHRKERSW